MQTLIISSSFWIKFIFTSVVFVFSTQIEAQNLVVNPSFETAGTLQCSWYLTNAEFQNAAPGWSYATAGSSDIFSTTLANTCYCSTNSTHANNPGPQAPRTGQRYANVVVYGSGGCTPYREYIQGSLSTPLQVGTTYEIEFYVSLGDKSTVATSNIGVKFGTTQVYSNTMCVYNVVPDVVYTGPPITDRVNWVRLVFYYTPTVANQRYFVIGNFVSDANTCTVPMAGGTNGTIRYYIDDVSIQAIANPPTDEDLGITNADLNLCNDLTDNLFTHLIGTGIPTTGTWSGPSTLTGGHLGTFNTTINTAGVYTYSWTGTGLCPVNGQARVNVTNEGVTITIPPIDDLCVTSEIVDLAATPTGGTWSGPGVTGATFNPATAGSGTHTISYNLGGLCPAEETTTINVTAAVEPTLTEIGPFCVTEAATNLTASLTGGTWSGPGVTASSFSPIDAGVGNHTITYSIGGLCPIVTTMQVEVNTIGDASITPIEPMCLDNGSVTLSAVNPGGTWSGTGVVGSTFDPETAGIGVHTITYEIEGLCPDIQTTTISVTATVEPTLTEIGPFCVTEAPTNLTASLTGGTWSGPGVTASSFSPIDAGVGNHTITYSIGGLCPNVTTMQVEVNTIGDASITPIEPMCLDNGSVTLSAVNPGGTWSGNGVVGSTFDPETAGIGVHTITYEIEGLCPDVQTTTITVNALSDATINPVGPFCTNDAAVTLTSVQTGGTWSGTGVTGSTFNPATAGAGSHTITYTIGGACPNTETIIIVVNEIPTLNPNVTPTIGCEPLEVHLTSDMPEGGTNRWRLGDGLFVNNQTDFYQTLVVPGCFDLFYTETVNGCTNSIILEDVVCVESNPVAEFTAALTEQDIDHSEFTMNNLSSNATSYEWDYFPFGQSNEEEPSIKIPVSHGDVDVCLIASNLAGCRDTICRPIRAEEMLIYYVPNTFTPDGDNMNQTFKPIFHSGFDPYDYTLLIFNRWGERIFESHNSEIGWDGTYNGILMQSGMYVYTIEFKLLVNDERQRINGHVNLLK